MIGNGDGSALRWTGRVLAAEDLRQSLDGRREVILTPGAIVTPLAAEELKARAIAVYEERQPLSPPTISWGWGADCHYPELRSALQALGREGTFLKEFPAYEGDLPCHWARAVAECIARGTCRGGVLFCEDPGLVCCVANKVPGLRAAAATSLGQAARAASTLGVNLLGVPMPGRTFFEVRQILRMAGEDKAGCPDGVASTLRELDGHAHR